MIIKLLQWNIWYKEDPNNIVKVITKVEEFLDNCGPDYSEKTWTTKPFNLNGFSENDLNWRLDYVLATKDIKIVSAEVVKTNYSDHLPLLVQIDFC